jgi:type VI secretion system secreted protein VgrG
MLAADGAEHDNVCRASLTLSDRRPIRTVHCRKLFRPKEVAPIMGKYSQANRKLAITTPLGEDALLIEKLSGSEAVSELFQFQASLLAEKQTDVAFDRLIGQAAKVEIHLPGGNTRYVHGIVARFQQGEEVVGAKGDHLIRYEAEIVPQVWLLTRRLQSRIFQQLSIPDILRAVFTGFDVALDLHTSYPARDFVVQYRETDFAFACRLMEDEGIYYYFKQTADGHQMLVSDAVVGRPELPDDSVAIFDPSVAGTHDTARIVAWRKNQEVRSGTYTLWDHTFELNDQSLKDHLQASAAVPDAVNAGSIKHGLKVASSADLELYEYPGGYASRYDGIDSAGSDQANNLAHIFQDNRRMAKVRLEQETAQALWIDGRGSYGNFLPGFQFTLQRHFNGDGPYVLTRVEHEANQDSTYTSMSPNEVALVYTNRFRCVPADLPVRPVRKTPRPIIPGTQTATVVGPSGSAALVDKYGRVKVQFHWDRQGKYNASSSCWVRVSQIWAGNRFGAFFWPRIGQEVVISFEDGDPDRPLIIGSVYNSSNMPPFELPSGVTASGIKSCSMGGNPSSDYNWLVFHDEPNDEHVHIHSENHEIRTSEASKHEYTPGPSVQVSGTLPFASLISGGSGGGGGSSSFPITGSGSGGGLLDILDLSKAITGEDAPEWLKTYGLLFPGAATYVTGSLIGSVLLGDQVYHTLGGASVNFCVDPEGIIWEAVTPGFSSKAFLPVGIASAILAGVGGAFAMTVGPNTGMTYSGPNLSILRGESIEYKTDNFWTDRSGMGIGTKVLVGLIAAAATAGDIAGHVMAAAKNEGGLEWAGLTSRALTQRLMGLLRILEEYNAKGHEALGKANAAVDMAKEITKLITTANPDAIDLTDKLATNANSRVQQALNNVTQVLNTTTGTADAALPNVGKTLTSDFSLRAFNIDLTSDTSAAPVGNVRLNSASDINIKANGGGANGSLRLAGSQLIDMNLNNGDILFSMDTTTSNVQLLNTLDANLTLQQGTIVGTYSQIKMANASIESTSGTAVLGTKITQTGTNIDLTAPAAGGQISFAVGPSSIVIKPDSITLQFTGWSVVINQQGIAITSAQSSVKVTPEGLQFSALNINSNATLSAVYQAVKLEEEAQALAEAMAALQKQQ